MTTAPVVIDGAHALLGRLASYAAKQALMGKQVVVINCSQTMLSGNRRFIINHYLTARGRGGNSLRGPSILKSPHRIVKRTIRGMVPHKQERGALAIKRVRCYNDHPAEYKDATIIHSKRVKPAKTMTLHELEREL